jgi:hypothetical protein
MQDHESTDDQSTDDSDRAPRVKDVPLSFMNGIMLREIEHHEGAGHVGVATMERLAQDLVGKRVALSMDAAKIDNGGVRVKHTGTYTSPSI